MAETPTKIYHPTNADTFDPAGDMESLARSITHIVQVDNAAERNAVADAYQPSTERPLFVYRADREQIEYTTGSGWHPVGSRRFVIGVGNVTGAWTPEGASGVLDENGNISFVGSIRRTLATTTITGSYIQIGTLDIPSGWSIESGLRVVQTNSGLILQGLVSNNGIFVRSQTGNQTWGQNGLIPISQFGARATRE